MTKEELYNKLYREFVIHWKIENVLIDQLEQKTSRRTLNLLDVKSFEELEEHSIESESNLTFITMINNERFFAECSYLRFKLIHQNAFYSQFERVTHKKTEKAPEEEKSTFFSENGSLKTILKKLNEKEDDASN